MTRKTYMSDDWDDNALTGRTSPETGTFLHPAESTEAGDCLVGMYRPEWTTEGGTPSASSGVLVLDGSEQVSTQSRFTTGSWAIDFTFQSDPTSAAFTVRFIQQDSNNRWDCRAINDGQLDTLKLDGGTATTIINGTWPDDLTTHTAKVTRSPYGDFEESLDGTSQGTATDAFLPSPDKVFFNNATSVTVHCDNLQVS